MRVSGWQAPRTATAPGTVVRIEHLAAAPAPRDELEALLAEIESTPDGAAQLAEGRRWVAGAFYGGERPTLAALRLRAGLSQAQLGERCGMQQPHVSRYESGRHEPGLAVSHAMAAALGVDLITFHAAWQATREQAERHLA